MDKRLMIEQIRETVNNPIFEQSANFEELADMYSIVTGIENRPINRTFNLLKNRIAETAEHVMKEKGVTFEQAISMLSKELMGDKK